MACETASDIPWLNVSPLSGVTNQGAADAVSVSFNSTGLAVGTYGGVLCVASNDPIVPLTQVPVTLTVPSCIAVSGADFTFNPALPKSGQNVTFNGSVAGGTAPITYTWNFGDTDIGGGQNVTHTFPLSTASQAYTVTLTTQNACGENAVQKQVTVVPYKLLLPVIRK